MQLYPYKQVSINQPPLNPFVNIFKALERAKKRDVAIRIWEVVQQEWPPLNLFKKSVGCSYYFEYIPLSKFGLPVPEK